MKIAIRADASCYIGSGHIMRCLVIADALKIAGHIVEFWCLPLSGNLIEYIKSRGHKVGVLVAELEEILPLQNNDYLSWLQQSIKSDAHHFIHNVGASDLVITDHYAIDYEWQKIISFGLCCRIVAIDDLCRNHFADFIIDQTLGRQPFEYQAFSSVLTGSKYALVSPRFAALRKKALHRSLKSASPRILISMGAVDSPNATLAVLKALVGKVSADFTVILGTNSPNFNEVENYCKSKGVQHINFTNDMPTLMLEHDIAIGAPGTTSWERACLGLPSIVIPLADNQRDVGKSLSIAKAAIVVELDRVSHDLKAAYYELINNYRLYHRSSLQVCDGLGVNRVLKELFE